MTTRSNITTSNINTAGSCGRGGDEISVVATVAPVFEAGVDDAASIIPSSSSNNNNNRNSSDDNVDDDNDVELLTTMAQRVERPPTMMPTITTGTTN
jgi:hypothetical protein